MNAPDYKTHHPLAKSRAPSHLPTVVFVHSSSSCPKPWFSFSHSVYWRRVCTCILAFNTWQKARMLVLLWNTDGGLTAVAEPLVKEAALLVQPNPDTDQTASTAKCMPRACFSRGPARDRQEGLTSNIQARWQEGGLYCPAPFGRWLLRGNLCSPNLLQWRCHFGSPPNVTLSDLWCQWAIRCCRGRHPVHPHRLWYFCVTWHHRECHSSLLAYGKPHSLSGHWTPQLSILCKSTTYSK